MKVLLSVLGIAYLLSPYDLFPDFFGGVGWLDDLILLGVLWWYLYVYKKRRQYGYQRERAQRGHAGTASHGRQNSRSQKEDSGSEKKDGSFTEPKDPYTVLEISRQASQEQIREAYLRLAGRYHLDKVLHLGKEFRDLAEVRFKEIQNAYDALKVK